jgi:hypothetical protein
MLIYVCRRLYAVRGRPSLSNRRFSSSVMVLKSSLCHFGKMRSVGSGVRHSFPRTSELSDTSVSARTLSTHMNRLFSNRGAANYVVNPYEEQIRRSREVLVAAPYVTETEQLVAAAQAGKKISLIVGINEGTSPPALSALIELPNCVVRYFTGGFHAKIYVFDLLQYDLCGRTPLASEP